MNGGNSEPDDATIDEIIRSIRDVEAALGRLNGMLSRRNEFDDLCDEAVWLNPDDPGAAGNKHLMRKVLMILEAYHAVWNQMTKCPIAALSLAPVRTHLHSKL